jgi:hypothetical protein
LVTARIRPATGRGLWLFVDRAGDNRVSAEDLNEFGFTREEDELGRVAYAVLPEEIAAIRDACDAWLADRDEQADPVADHLLHGAQGKREGGNS